MTAYPISIPGPSSRMEMAASPISMASIASPFSISSPFSGHSSLSSNNSGSNTSQRLGSSFATSITSVSSADVASAASPSSDLDSSIVEEYSVGGGDPSVKKHKPHQCDVCGSCFARKVHLQRHSLRHQVCKPYCCERCGKCFSRQDSLVRHHRLLHEKIREKPKKAAGTTKKRSSSSSGVIQLDFDAPRSSNFMGNKGSSSARSASASSLKRAPRRQSISQLTSDGSYGGEEEEDMASISEEANPFSLGGGHGPRRNTVSTMETFAACGGQQNLHCSFPRVFDDGLYNPPSTSTWASQLLQPHPFEMPQLDAMSFADVKSLHPQQLHQHLPMQSNLQETTIFNTSAPATSEHDIPLLSLFQQASSLSDQSAFDWTALTNASMGEGLAPRDGAMPFSKSASDKSLNATLSRGPDVFDSSAFPSPAIHALQQQQQQQPSNSADIRQINNTTVAPSQSQTATVNLASLGLPVPPNLNVNIPADLQMSADNWDNLMRCLTSMANRQVESAKSS